MTLRFSDGTLAMLDMSGWHCDDDFLRDALAATYPVEPEPQTPNTVGILGRKVAGELAARVISYTPPEPRPDLIY